MVSSGSSRGSSSASKGTKGTKPARASSGTTKGRQGAAPARVFWVRRFVVLGVPLLVVALVAWWLLRPDGAPAPVPVASTSAPAVAEPSPSDTFTPVGGIDQCAAGTLTLAITPDAASFGPGVSASFSVSIINSGTLPCVVDAGEAYRELVITSGDDRVWSNRDCASADADPRTLLLDAGQQDVTQLAWNRERSAVGCPAGLPAPGAGTYQVTFALAGSAAQPAVFVLE